MNDPRMERKRRIPKRWLGCPPYGDLVDETFKPMKTMLDDDISMDPKYKFTPDLMMARMKEEKVNIGLVINLTPIQERYDKMILIDKYGICFEKISCPGALVPREAERVRFIKVCRTFLAEHPGKKIAVHCTHGCNRTGFMICSFLTMLRGYTIEDAIGLFETKRPPGIYKQEFVDCLFRMYANWRFRGPTPKVGPEPKWSVENETFVGDGHEELMVPSYSCASADQGRRKWDKLSRKASGPHDVHKNFERMSLK